METTLEAGKLVENLGTLWRNADLAERHQLIAGMLDAVYIAMVETRQVVAVSPKPPFPCLLEVVSTKADSGLLIANGKQKPASNPDTGDDDGWFRWRRGRVQLHHFTYLSVLVAASWGQPTAPALTWIDWAEQASALRTTTGNAAPTPIIGSDGCEL